MSNKRIAYIRKRSEWLIPFASFTTMPNKLIITLSGKKQAGKNTACNFILAMFYNRRLPPNAPQWGVDPVSGELQWGGRPLQPNGIAGTKIYSFADPLKRFCIDVLGVPEEGCYGTDAQKNALVPHLLWENFPQECRPYKDVFIEEKYVEFSGVTNAASSHREYRKGPMTGRDVMQVIGTDLCRKMYDDCWAKGTYNSIKREGFELALICDGRFPNEINLGIEAGAKTIRLARNVYNDSHRSETALDDYDNSKYSLYIDNTNMSISQQCEIVGNAVEQWFNEAGL